MPSSPLADTLKHPASSPFGVGAEAHERKERLRDPAAEEERALEGEEDQEGIGRRSTSKPERWYGFSKRANL